jgi:hypothetical protein
MHRKSLGLRSVAAVVIASALAFALGPTAKAHSPALATSGGSSPSPQPNVTVASQLIADPSFEAGASNPSWQQISSRGFATISTVHPHTGAWSADLCGYTSCNPDEVTQAFTAPSSVTTATLQYWYAFRCDIGPCFNSHESLTIGLHDDTTGVFDQTAYRFAAAPGQLIDYQAVNRNVLTFMQNGAGHPMHIFATASSSDAGEFFIDDIGLAITATPGAPTNVTVASSSPATVVLTWTNPTYEGTSPITGIVVTEFDRNRTILAALSLAPGTTTQTFNGASVPPVMNGVPYYYSVGEVNAVGRTTVLSYSVTPLAGTAPPARASAVSTSQYVLPNSDGATWQVLDETGLGLSHTAGVGGEDLLLSVNADLWTWNAGFNQDIGITVNGSLVGWKESGGFAGTFSPNAAFLETVVHVGASATVAAQVVWKTNKPAILAGPIPVGASISAGAGPLNAAFSPTRLVAKVLPAAGFTTKSSTQQYNLVSSDGSTWAAVDATNLSFMVTPGVTGDLVLSGNADLWTWNPGFNQDIGITVNGTLVAWKESGGFAGAFSPNAAFVQTVYHVIPATTYTIQLVWKTNKPDSGAITIGAGSGPYSPTALTEWLLPTGASTWGSAVSTTQYTLGNSDGSTWVEMDAAHLTTTLASAPAESILVSGNADLWTSNAGFNQDIALFVTDNGTAQQLLAWKESGGFGGTFSPNAAFVQATYTMVAGHTYVFSIWWKSNKNASGATIWAGAGPISSAFSPTRLTIAPA